MTSLCLYFQVHQPYRLKRYTVFHSDHFYFDNDKNREVCLKVAEKFDVSREDQDRFALESHRKAVAAVEADRFADEIEPIDATSCQARIQGDALEWLAFIFIWLDLPFTIHEPPELLDYIAKLSHRLSVSLPA